MKPKLVRPREGLVLYRWLMIIGSFAPLFILLMIKGTPTISDPKLGSIKLIADAVYFWSLMALTILPTLAIVFRIRHSIKVKDRRTIVADQVTDSREHLLIYLFALLLPLYANSYLGIRDIWAAIALIFFVFFILYHLSLHYMNLLFAIFGYRVYTVRPKSDGNPFTGQCPFVVLSKRHSIPSGTELDVNRISDTVYIEYEGRN